MADAINPGSAILERAGVSSSWIMVDYKVILLNGTQVSVNQYDIACILSLHYAVGAINIPGLFLAGSGFTVTTSSNGSMTQIITNSTNTSIYSLAAGIPGMCSILFYKFPSE